MRQPEVTGLPALAGAALLALPVLDSARASVVAALFLCEFLTGGARPALSAVTPAPVRTTLDVAGAAVDRYARPSLRAPTPLVLVHGFTADGKDDARLRQAADWLARAGFAVAVPTVPGLTRGRLRADDVRAVVTTVAAVTHDRPAALLGISVGAGPALVAAADPRVRNRIAMIVSLGGYASARELVRFFLTGDYAFGAVTGHVDHDPALVRMFIDANADLLDDATRAQLASGDRARVRSFLAAPPAAVRAALDDVSPVRVVSELRAPLLAIHGRGDRAVPYTESLRLAAARPTATWLVVIGAVGHVERAETGQELRDVVALWAAVYRLVAGA